MFLSDKVINEKWSKMQRDADICLGRVQDIMEEQRARIEYLEARNSELVEENIRLKQQGAKLNHQQVYNEATKALDSGFYTGLFISLMLQLIFFFKKGFKIRF